MTGGELAGLRNRYDWVFNARRLMIEANADGVAADLRRIIAQVGRNEHPSPCETEK